MMTSVVMKRSSDRCFRHRRYANLAKLAFLGSARQWYENVAQKLVLQNITNTDLRLIPLDHPLTAPEQTSYEVLPNYVNVLQEFPDASLDWVLVDGHYRTHCTRSSFNKLKPLGYLMVDDSQFWQSPQQLGIPTDWPRVSHTSNGIKMTSIWQKPGEHLSDPPEE